MRRSDFSIPAAVIGRLPGPMAETRLFTTMMSYDCDPLPFFTRSIRTAPIVYSLSIIVAPEFRPGSRRLAAARAGVRG